MLRSTLLTIFKLAVTLGLLLAVFLWVDLEPIVESAAAADAALLLVALLLQPVNMALEGWMWHRLVRLEIPGVRVRDTMGSMMAGFSLGFVTPANVGEFAGRSFYLDHPRKWALSNLVLVERLLMMGSVLLVGAPALVLYTGVVASSYTLPLVVAAGVGAVLGVLIWAAVFAPRRAWRLVARLFGRDRLPTVRFLRVLGSADAVLLAAVGGLRFVAYALQFYILLLAFAPGVPLAAGLLGVTLVLFAKYMIPSVTLVDLGIREGAAVFFFGTLGLSEAMGFNASLMVFALTLFVPAVLGLPFVYQLPESAPRLADLFRRAPALEGAEV